MCARSFLEFNFLLLKLFKGLSLLFNRRSFTGVIVVCVIETIVVVVGVSEHFQLSHISKIKLLNICIPGYM